MSKHKHSGKQSDSHNQSLFYNTQTSEYPSPNSVYCYNSNDEETDHGKQIILNKFFNSVVIYENLCMNCGYPLYDKSSIYEHLCIECINFEHLSHYNEEPKSIIKKRNIIGDLIFSIKRITSSNNSNNKTTNQRLEIIHNIDTVFKTNKTFDINEICKLKRSSKSLEAIASSDRNRTSYKEKNTNTNLFSNEDKRIEFNNIDDWMASLRTHTCYYQLTDTENISNVKSIPSKNGLTFNCCSFPSDLSTSIHMSLNSLESVSFFSDISNNSSPAIELNSNFIDDEYKNQVLKFKNNLIKMESKQDSYQTQMKNVKLRSNKRYLHNKHCMNIVGEPSPSHHDYNESDSSQSVMDSDCSRQLDLYQSRNRNGFYGKHSSSSDFVNDILTVFDSYLKCDSLTHTLDGSIQLTARSFEDTNTDTNQSYSYIDKPSASDKNEHEQYTLKCTSYAKYNFIKINQPIDIYELLKNLHIDIALNKIVICYDNNLKIFIKYIEQKKKSRDLLLFVNLFVKWMTNLQKESQQLEQGKIMTLPMIRLTADSDGKNSSIQNTEEEESIYQSIWKFKTFEKEEMDNSAMTEARSCESPVDLDSLECDDGEWEPADDISYHPCQVNSHSSDTIKSQQSSSSEIVLTHASKTINDNFRHETNFNRKCDIGYQYNTICILYSEQSEDIKLRAIIYDYQPTEKYQNIDIIDKQIESNENSLGYVKHNNPCNTILIDDRINYIELWKRCLYMEDEEDMYISSQEISSFKRRPVLLVNESIYDRPRDPPNSSLKLYKSISSGNLLDVTANDKKTITENLKNKFQRGLLKFNVRPRDNKVRKHKGINSLYLDESLSPIFGAKLEDLETHFSFKYVPKFLVDAVDIIERMENIQVDGLYRTSGNKVDVDNLKKKLLTSTYDKSYLITDDVNTLTSLLKLFFRELQTPLIPEVFYDQLPTNLLKPESVHLIKHILNNIPQLSQQTLKFLLKHLKVVSQHSQSNRMPASNLAIVWGPCILAANNLGPLDIARMNTLAKVLIENYEDIFDEKERYIL